MVGTPSAAPRRGTVLILVAGISALLASLALSFLVRMRTDAEESDRTVRLAQAHIMLVAACNFIQERSRLGWDDPATPIHEEAFGWVDVRNGGNGPCSQLDATALIPTAVNTWADIGAGNPLSTRPAARQPMYVMRRPPFAVQPLVAPNPIATSGDATRIGVPLAAKRDPEPVIDAYTSAAQWSLYAAGDRTPVPSGQTGAWFRVLRDGPATFVVTCGCGGTMGFRLQDWSGGAHAMSAADKALFADDLDTFRELEAQEVRLWYRVEWSPNVAAADYQCIENNLGGDHYVEWPINASAMNADTDTMRSQPHPANMVGTIRWVQRLVNEPTYW